MITSRKLEDLLPTVRGKVEKFILDCRIAGIDILITSTYRDNEAQAELYAQGRTKPGKIVTNAGPGQSFHNYRVAFDFVPLVNGKPQWSDLKMFEVCGEIAEGVGLEWAGRWTKFREFAHCQYTGGLSIADLRSGKQVI